MHSVFYAGGIDGEPIICIKRNLLCITEIQNKEPSQSLPKAPKAVETTEIDWSYPSEHDEYTKFTRRGRCDSCGRYVVAPRTEEYII